MGVSITRRRLLFLAWEIFRHDQLYSQGTIALSTTYNLEREGSALSLAPESFFSQGGFGQVCMDTGESLAANQYRLESMVRGKVVLLLPR